MVSFPLQSLLDLCCIRIAYLMWTRRDLTKKCSIVKLFDQLVDVVLADVQTLPLPEQLKSRIFYIVMPAGKRLLRLLDLWLSKTEPRNSQKWITGEMLFECLILNADGLINERKTAEKILSSRTVFKYSVVFAFRLACVNFLEMEVLKLWILVKQILLHKISKEGCDPLRFSAFFTGRFTFVKKPVIARVWKYIYEKRFSELPSSSCTTEPDEVLFWISYCLSKENATDIKEVPHFIGNDVDWYEFSLESAAYSGNVACLDYFINICKREVEYNYVGIIIGNFFVDQKNSEQPCFIFHFMLLDSQEKAELFREYPRKMVGHFLQWPLSQTFVENTEEIWNLIPDDSKYWVLLKVFAILVHENPLLNPITDFQGISGCYIGFNDLIHSVEHFRRIWIALWEISLDSDKLTVLNTVVFKSITHSRRHRKFRTYFRASGLKKKLLHLFLSNGEAVLELYEGATMKNSLRNLVAKYMPENFEDLDRRCISFLKTQTKQYRMKMKREMKLKIEFQHHDLFISRNHPQPVHDNFLNHIKKVAYLN
ncbi:hypothetical protein AVEN_24729-1 [Araneus ventricosus]|uniref:Uncharacterized protein n=1 Tax=Araneus ventricosus TaxID=182803 RepID=A0A4Y2TPD8_ARAVE|nr:hypothetical protein AVEN_275533-1 [Araneus ventricosus]GBO01277.1 hypothetical protein AVEN_24729-1 [Araneus ventricosus]